MPVATNNGSKVRAGPEHTGGERADVYGINAIVVGRRAAFSSVDNRKRKGPWSPEAVGQDQILGTGFGTPTYFRRESRASGVVVSANAIETTGISSRINADLRVIVNLVAGRRGQPVGVTRDAVPNAGSGHERTTWVDRGGDVAGRL